MHGILLGLARGAPLRDSTPLISPPSRILAYQHLFIETVKRVLRFAESPSFYQPYWSEKIMDETRKALVERLREYFAAAWVANYEPFIETMFNHRGDRHVLAAAMKAGAQTVVTFNIRHFPAKSTEPLGIEAQSPDEFLVHQFHLRPQLAALKDFRASGRNRPVTQPGLRYALAHGS